MANHFYSSPLLLKKTRSLRCPARTVQLVSDTPPDPPSPSVNSTTTTTATTAGAAAAVAAVLPAENLSGASRLRRVFTTHGCRWSGGRRNNRRPSITAASSIALTADEPTSSERLASFIAQHSAGVHHYKLPTPSGGAANNRSDFYI